MTLTACASETSGLPAMSCEILNKTEDCSAVPMLNKGHLKMMPNQQFELKAQYNACYHKETVIIHGQYQHTDYGKELNIELLATHIEGHKSSQFPSTIAVLTMEESSLQGVLHDVWATIRSPKNNEKSAIAVTCVLD